MNHEEKLKKIKVRLLVNEPFFGHLMSSIDMIPHDNIPKFQVYGNKIYYNKTYIENTDNLILTNQLLHCIMHIAFCHFVRKRDRRSGTWNKSTDIAINNILKFENNKRIDGITDNKYRSKSAENIYEDLKLDENNNGYEGGFDLHVDTYDRQAEEEAKRNVVEAHAVARTIGTMPAGMSSLIKDLLEPKLNWKELLRKFATECFANEDYSFTNPRKCLLPYEIYCASLMHEADTLRELVVAVDTSGSIRDQELKEFFAEIRMLHHLSEKTKVITCDAAIHDVYTLNIHDTIKEIKFKGRGGTDFRPVFKYLKEHKMSPTLLLYLTDGYGGYPEKAPEYPTMWVLTEKYEVPWGQSILMEKT